MSKLVSILVSLLLLNIVSINAQTIKIGYFDSKSIFESLPEKAMIQKDIEDLQAKYEVEETKMLEEYKVKVANFLEEKNLLNNNIAEARAQEIDQLQQRIELFRNNAAKDLKQSQETLLSPLFEKINAAIKTIGEQYGFACIFDISEGNVPYISPTLCEDCTDLIKAALEL